VGVSVDHNASAAHFCEHLNLKFSLLGDWPAPVVGRAYDVFNDERHIHRRTTFVIDKQGVIRARIDDRDPAEHPKKALETLRALS
jgi:peroxiredoxin